MNDTTTTERATITVNGTAFPYRPEVRNPWQGLPNWFDVETNQPYAATSAQGFYANADRSPHESAGVIREEAYALDAEYSAILARSTVEPVESLADRDARAAQAQAEVLGATADQRAKLRQIVEERQQAQAEVTRLLTEVERLREPITDAEDERVLGLFVQAAEEADRQGYCSTYEQIAGAVGIPGRDRLRELGALSPRVFDFTVRVTTYVTVTASGADVDDAWENADVDDAIANHELSDAAQWSSYTNYTEVTDY